MSDFPNIPAGLSGSFGDRKAELHGVFHLDVNYEFQRGSVVGRIGAVNLEASVLATSPRPSNSQTVAVEGTYGPMSFEINATIDGSQGIVHGTVDEAIIHLDLMRPSVPRNVRAGYPPIDVPGPEVVLLGGYHGPPELLALIIGAILQFT